MKSPSATMTKRCSPLGFLAGPLFLSGIAASEDVSGKVVGDFVLALQQGLP